MASMQVELVSFGIDRFNLENEVQGAAKGFSSEGDGLAYGGWTFWLTPFYLDIGPLGPAFPLYEILPDHLNRGCDYGGGTDCQTHSMFLRLFAVCNSRVVSQKINSLQRHCHAASATR